MPDKAGESDTDQQERVGDYQQISKITYESFQNGSLMSNSSLSEPEDDFVDPLADNFGIVFWLGDLNFRSKLNNCGGEY